MTGLREFVAQAIMSDVTCGGPNILRDEERDALLRGALMLQQHGNEQHANVLRQLMVDLGANNMPFLNEPKPRVDAYYRHCADVAISAYDKWLKDRTAAMEADMDRIG